MHMKKRFVWLIALVLLSGLTFGNTVSTSGTANGVTINTANLDVGIVTINTANSTGNNFVMVTVDVWTCQGQDHYTFAMNTALTAAVDDNYASNGTANYQANVAMNQNTGTTMEGVVPADNVPIVGAVFTSTMPNGADPGHCVGVNVILPKQMHLTGFVFG